MTKILRIVARIDSAGEPVKDRRWVHVRRPATRSNAITCDLGRVSTTVAGDLSASNSDLQATQNTERTMLDACGHAGSRAIALLSVKPAIAGDDEQQHVTGFITYANGEVAGQVTDEDGKPVAGAKVHLATPSGTETVISTDRQGRFKSALPGDDGHTMVYVQGGARITGHATVPSEHGSPGEIVEIHEVIRPAVMPKPLSHPNRILDYTRRGGRSTRGRAPGCCSTSPRPARSRGSSC